MAFTEDLSGFFDLDGFAVEAVYDGTDAIPVIFDNAYLEQLGLVAGRDPVVLCQASKVAFDPTGLTLMIGSALYEIRNIEPQDDGAIVLLRLHLISGIPGAPGVRSFDSSFSSAFGV